MDWLSRLFSAVVGGIIVFLLTAAPDNARAEQLLRKIREAGRYLFFTTSGQIDLVFLVVPLAAILAYRRAFKNRLDPSSMAPLKAAVLATVIGVLMVNFLQANAGNIDEILADAKENLPRTYVLVLVVLYGFGARLGRLIAQSASLKPRDGPKA